MITKFVNETGNIVFAETQEDLLSTDIQVGSAIMISGFFYKIQASHIEFVKNFPPHRVVIVKIA
ncbi:dTMP synthase [Citrobacter phage CkP1]|nr:dTMP synthase [Citrobacter phage CkP1]